MTDPTTRASLLCLVFTDLVDSTALKTRLGEAAVSALMGHLSPRRAGARGPMQRARDRLGGGGFFLAFEAPSAAVAFALRLQQLHQRKPELPAVRVGLHLGEVTERAAPPGSSKPTLI